MTTPIRRPCTAPDEDCPDFAIDGTPYCLHHQEPYRADHEHDWFIVAGVKGHAHQACRGCTATRAPWRAYGPDCTGASPHTPVVDGPREPVHVDIPARPYDDEHEPAPDGFDEPAPRGWLARAITWAASW